MKIVLQGEECHLLAERALHWPATRTLFVADAHFGKADCFRSKGIPVPVGSTAASLQRLSRAISKTAAERLIVLGDFWHAEASTAPNVIEEIARWRKCHSQLRVDLVRGNHDRFRYEMPADWRFAVHDMPVVLGPFLAAHYPTPREQCFVLAGHLHPAYQISGRARQSVTLPCFWFGPDVGVLPAFGGFTGSATVNPQPGDRLYVIAGDEIAEVPN